MQHTADRHSARNSVERVILVTAKIVNEVYKLFAQLLRRSLKKLKTVRITSAPTERDPETIPSIGYIAPSKRTTPKAVPSFVLQAVDKRTPRVSLEIDLWGSISECISVLKTVSCLRACHLNLQQSITPLSDGHAIPEENFSVECLQNQTTFDSISLSVPNEWPTVSPKGTLGFHPLQLKEIEIEFAVKVRPAARGFVDGKNLEILSIYGFDLITSFLEGFENKLPSLKTVRFFPSKHHGVTGQFEEFVHDSHYTQIMGFFSKTALQEIGLHNFTQKMPWLDMLSVSAYSLRQLTIHTKSSCWESVRTVDPNVPRQPPELINSPNKAHLQVHPKPVLTAAELYRLASLCPNLERLGFDVHAMTVKQARSGPLKALSAFPNLRHLHIFFHPDYPIVTLTPFISLPAHRWPQGFSLPIPGSELLELFLRLRRKKGIRIESIFYHSYESQSHPAHSCILWAMGEGRVLLVYRDKWEVTDMKELYQGRKLLWT